MEGSYNGNLARLFSITIRTLHIKVHWSPMENFMLMQALVILGFLLLFGDAAMGNNSVACCSKPCVASKLPPNITVYNYLSIQGPNSTKAYNTVQCGQALKSGGSVRQTLPFSFGQQYCFDMPLFLTKNLKSKVLGRVQGTFTFVSLSDLSPSGTTATLFVAETFTLNTTFTAQGSITAVGLEQIGMTSNKPLTGGAGDFTLVTGVATTTPLSNGTDRYGNFGSWFKYVFTFNTASSVTSIKY